MATIHDVAARAGVSARTVSRVLNGSGLIGERTRVAVEAAMREVRVVPSRATQSVHGARSGLVGLVTGAIPTSPDLGRPAGFSDILVVQLLLQVLARAGLTLMISDTDDRSECVPRLVQTILRQRVEDLIHVADHYRSTVLPQLPPGTPLALANCFDEPGTPAILPSDRRGRSLLAARTIAAGHRRIHVLTLREGLEATALRLRGCREALAPGLSFDLALVRPFDLGGGEAES